MINTIDSASMVQGWLVGEKIAAMRGKGEEPIQPPVPPIRTDAYLTFSSDESFTIQNYLYPGPGKKTWDGSIYYSTDTETWSEWDASGQIRSAEHNGKQCIYMRGSGNSVITSYGEESGVRWMISGGKVRCDGNIETLLNWETVAGLSSTPIVMGEKCYDSMFELCTELTIAPKLPATTMAEACYKSMFYGCDNLEVAPELPADTLANECYSRMFCACTKLAKAPVLPATVMKWRCYYQMFRSCNALTVAPALPATELYAGCYDGMFMYCSALTHPPALPAQITKPKEDEYCYNQMFYQCKALVALPKLPSVGLAEHCYESMFYGCTNIELSTEQTDEYPNEYRIPAEGTATEVTDPTKYMFGGTGGTFVGTPAINTVYHTSNTVV